MARCRRLRRRREERAELAALDASNILPGSKKPQKPPKFYHFHHFNPFPFPPQPDPAAETPKPPPKPPQKNPSLPRIGRGFEASSAPTANEKKINFSKRGKNPKFLGFLGFFFPLGGVQYLRWRRKKPGGLFGVGGSWFLGGKRSWPVLRICSSSFLWRFMSDKTLSRRASLFCPRLGPRF